MVVDMLRMLPKLMGLNHDLVTGNALLTANGTVMQAPRLGVNGYRANGVHSKVVAKAALLANRPASDSVSNLIITPYRILSLNPCSILRSMKLGE